jgi:hypothetical protein
MKRNQALAPARRGAVYRAAGELRRLQAVLLKHPAGDREMVNILALALQHDEQAVLCAVELALESIIASKPHVLNPLSRLVEPVGRSEAEQRAGKAHVQL